MSNITTAFKDTLFDDQIEQSISDLTKIELGNAIDDYPFAQLPLIKTLFGTAQAIKNLRNILLIHKTGYFLLGLNLKTISKDKLNRYKKHLENEEYAQKECGRVLMILDHITEYDKATLLGKLYRAYINEAFDQETFYELTTCLEMLFLQDIDLIIKLGQGNSIKVAEVPQKINRLQSLGLVTTPFNDGGNPRFIDISEPHATISDLGMKLCRYALSD